MRDFHCCATCIHFRVIKESGKTKYACSRLGFETKTHFQFNCWAPKEQVKRLMVKERKGGMA